MAENTLRECSQAVIDSASELLTIFRTKYNMGPSDKDVRALVAAIEVAESWS
jgi:hypothetical protein